MQLLLLSSHACTASRWSLKPRSANPHALNAPNPTQDDTTPGGGVTLLLSRAPSTSPVALPGSDVATSPSSLLVTRAEVEAIARQAVSTWGSEGCVFRGVQEWPPAPALGASSVLVTRAEVEATARQAVRSCFRRTVLPWPALPAYDVHDTRT